MSPLLGRDDDSASHGGAVSTATRSVSVRSRSDEENLEISAGSRAGPSAEGAVKEVVLGTRPSPERKYRAFLQGYAKR